MLSPLRPLDTNSAPSLPEPFDSSSCSPDRVVRSDSRFYSNELDEMEREHNAHSQRYCPQQQQQQQQRPLAGRPGGGRSPTQPPAPPTPHQRTPLAQSDVSGDGAHPYNVSRRLQSPFLSVAAAETDTTTVSSSGPACSSHDPRRRRRGTNASGHGAAHSTSRTTSVRESESPGLDEQGHRYNQGHPPIAGQTSARVGATAAPPLILTRTHSPTTISQQQQQQQQQEQRREQHEQPTRHHRPRGTHDKPHRQSGYEEALTEYQDAILANARRESLRREAEKEAARRRRRRVMEDYSRLLFDRRRSRSCSRAGGQHHGDGGEDAKEKDNGNDNNNDSSGAARSLSARRRTPSVHDGPGRTPSPLYRASPREETRTFRENNMPSQRRASSGSARGDSGRPPLTPASCRGPASGAGATQQPPLSPSSRSSSAPAASNARASPYRNTTAGAFHPIPSGADTRPFQRAQTPPPETAARAKIREGTVYCGTAVSSRTGRTYGIQLAAEPLDERDGGTGGDESTAAHAKRLQRVHDANNVAYGSMYHEKEEERKSETTAAAFPLPRAAYGTREEREELLAAIERENPLCRRPLAPPRRLRRGQERLDSRRRRAASAHSSNSSSNSGGRDHTACNQQHYDPNSRQENGSTSQPQQTLHEHPPRQQVPKRSVSPLAAATAGIIEREGRTPPRRLYDFDARELHSPRRNNDSSDFAGVPATRLPPPPRLSVPSFALPDDVFQLEAELYRSRHGYGKGSAGGGFVGGAGVRRQTGTAERTDARAAMPPHEKPPERDQELLDDVFHNHNNGNEDGTEAAAVVSPRPTAANRNDCAPKSAARDDDVTAVLRKLQQAKMSVPRTMLRV